MRLKLPLLITCIVALIVNARAAYFPADTLTDKKVAVHTPQPPATVSQVQVRDFKELDAMLAKQVLQVPNAGNAFTSQFYEQFNTSNTIAEEYKAKAKSVVNEIEAANAFIDVLTPSDVNKLPIGLKKKVGNTDVVIAVSSIVFRDTYSELTVFARVKIPQAPKEIFFGVSGIKLSHTGGIIGDARLVLLGNLAIPFNGGNASVILKGGINLQNGQAAGKTYVTIDCNGFKELGVAADIEFPRSLLLPVDAGGAILDSGNVKGSFQTVISNWNDILAEDISFTPFQINGLKNINFSISNAVIDLSDYRNSGNLVYPAGYQQKYLAASGDPNTWRGVYARNISVTLPNAFKDRLSGQKVSFGVNNLIVDNNGLTGLFYAENVLPINKGSASGWKFSVDSIRIGIEANHLTRAGFGGKIGLPVNNDFDTTNKRKFLAYSAFITAGSDYVCKVSTMDSLDFDVWKAKVTLYPNSYVLLTGNSESLKPEAMLSGRMSILSRSYGESADRPANKAPVADFKGIVFEQLHIRTEAPYVRAQYFGYTGAVKLGNFPVSIEHIGLSFPSNSNEVALGFTVKVDLQDKGFGGSTRLHIVGEYNEEAGLRSLKYKRLKIDSINLYADLGGFKMDGTVHFMDDNPVYGDGFMGDITAEFRGAEISVEVAAIFGNKGYRYWFVDGLARFQPPIGTGIVNIHGFGGGAYYRMRKTGGGATSSPTGMNYVPDSTLGLGVKAAVLLDIGSDKLDEVQVSYEAAFNRGGGIRYIGLYGYLKVMGKIPGTENVENFLSSKFQDIENKLNSYQGDLAQLEQMKIFQPSAAAKDVYPSDEQPGESGISSYVGIIYNFEENSLHATYDMYVNAAGGLLQGAASGNRAGWGVLHIDPSIWYLHMGTPTDRIGIKIGIGPLTLRTATYFMVGQNIPAFPNPPQDVINILADAGLQYTPTVNLGSVNGGNGVAFGTGVSLQTGDIRFLMFYAKFSAGIGFDVMLKDGHTCNGAPIGINGWYAQGQAYAYLQGELGVRIKIGPFKKNVSIIKGGAAALLQAKLPNPTWVGGYLGFHVDILGGLIKGRFNFKFSFGSDCQIERDDVYDYDDFKVVLSATPANNTNRVSVFARPQVTFNIKPNTVMEVTNDDGSTGRFWPNLDYVKIMDGSQEVPGRISFDNDGKILTYSFNDILKGNTTYKILTKVSFQEYKNGQWINITVNGQAVEELKEFTFTTGALPDSIAPDNIESMYPFFNQRFVYKNEQVPGYLTLKVGMAPLFATYNSWKVRFVSNGQVAATADAVYNNTDRKVTFTLPAALNTASSYKMQLYGVGAVGSSNSDTTKPALTVSFSTSRYNTLAEKIQSFVVTQNVVGRISSDIIDLQAQVSTFEGFELAELTGNTYTNNQPLIAGTATVDDSYFTDYIRPLVYPSYPLTGGGVNFYLSNRDTAVLGLPPVRAIKLSGYYIRSLQSPVYNSFVYTRMPFIYDLGKFYNKDFNDLRTQVVNHYLNYQQAAAANSTAMALDQQLYYVDDQEIVFADAGFSNYDFGEVQQQVNTIPSVFHDLVTQPFPFMNKGAYKVILRLKLPDGSSGSSAQFTYNNPID